jgi:hypothetical protein
MDPSAKEIIIRFYGDTFMRSLDANDIMARAMSLFPKLERLVFENMSDAERTQAALVDRDGIVRVRNRCFVYAQIGHECRRVESLEVEIERSTV